MKLSFRLLLFIVILNFGAAWAQAYPDRSRSLRILVPFGAGSSTDVLARALARGMTEVAGMTAIVENKAGAEGQIGMSAGKAALPDGYTLVMTTSSTQVLNPHMLSNMPYDPVTDFIPVAGVARFALIMNAGPSVNFKNAKEFIAAARNQPGKYSFGSGTATTRLAAEMLQRVVGIKLLSVPFKSQTDAITALAGGQVDIVFMDLPGSSAPHKTGRVRPLAVTGSSRIAALPEVQTLKEQGFPECEMTGWWGIYLPAKTPPEIVAAVRGIVPTALKTQAVRDAFTNFSLEPMPAVGDELATLQRNESQRWGQLIRRANLAGP
jgi:tripartite-type tricarboxylate transporter receptor subunit TctC